MSTYGTLHAGKLVLYENAITVTDTSLGDLRVTDLDLSGLNRLRTTEAECVFSFHHVHGKEDVLFGEAVGSNASSTHSATKSYVELAVTGTSGRAVRQSYLYVPYHPGGSHVVAIGALLSTAAAAQPAGVRSRVGLFDDASDKTVDTGTGNGFFFEMHGGAFRVGMRTSTTTGSSQTDTLVEQAAFSEDPLDGTGASTFTLDPYAVQTFVVDLTWLGSGVVRMGVVRENKILWCHVFTFASLTVPFCKYASLPVRAEIQAVTGSSADSMRILSGAVWADGGMLRRRRRHFSYGTGVTGVSCTSTTRRPILSLRLSASANRAALLARAFDVMSDRECLWEVYLRGTLTGASFSAANAYSRAEADISATAISGGILLKSLFGTGRATLELDPESEHLVTSTIGGDSYILSLCCSKISETVVAFATAEWVEL